MSNILPKDVIEIHSVKEFNELTDKYRKNPIVIDFWAPWCGPCKSFHPVFIDAQKTWGNYFIFARVNTDENPGISQQLGIQGVPTIGFVKNNILIHSQSGALRKTEFDNLLKLIKQNIENESKNSSSLYS